MIKNLVFEGGGIKGFGYVGAIEALEDFDLLKDVERLAGTSVGAIIALLASIGMNSRQMRELFFRTDFTEFLDGHPSFISRYFRMSRNYGLYKGKRFVEWIQNVIQNHHTSAHRNLTFSQLYEDFGKDLRIVGTNLSTQKPIVFCYDNTPNTPLYQAIRISMSIPMFFECVKEGPMICVDGGLVWNYPINIFDEISKPSETLGFRVDTENDIQIHKNQKPEFLKIETLEDYASSILNLLLNYANKTHIKEDDWKRTVYIKTDIPTLKFDIKKYEMIELFINGRLSTKKYLENFYEKPEI